MRFKIQLFLLVTLFPVHLHAQEIKRNSVFVELGGVGGLYSINYERNFSKGLVARIGFAAYQDTFVIPVTFGNFFGEKAHHFEIDAGATYLRLLDDELQIKTNIIVATAFVGYRYQKPTDRFLFRAGLTPLLIIYHEENVETTDGLVFSGGISFGYRF